MSYKICVAMFAVEDTENVQRWTRFSSDKSALIVPTLEFKGNPDDIEEQLKELTSTILAAIDVER